VGFLNQKVYMSEIVWQNSS